MFAQFNNSTRSLHLKRMSPNNVRCNLQSFDPVCQTGIDYCRILRKHAQQRPQDQASGTVAQFMKTNALYFSPQENPQAMSQSGPDSPIKTFTSSASSSRNLQKPNISIVNAGQEQSESLTEKNDILNEGTYPSLAQLPERGIAAIEWDNFNRGSICQTNVYKNPLERDEYIHLCEAKPADGQGQQLTENLVDYPSNQQTKPQATEIHLYGFPRDQGLNQQPDLCNKNCESIARHVKEEQRSIMSPQTDILSPAAVSFRNGSLRPSQRHSFGAKSRRRIKALKKSYLSLGSTKVKPQPVSVKSSKANKSSKPMDELYFGVQSDSSSEERSFNNFRFQNRLSIGVQKLQKDKQTLKGYSTSMNDFKLGGEQLMSGTHHSITLSSNDSSIGSQEKITIIAQIAQDCQNLKPSKFRPTHDQRIENEPSATSLSQSESVGSLALPVNQEARSLASSQSNHKLEHRTDTQMPLTLKGILTQKQALRQRFQQWQKLKTIAIWARLRVEQLIVVDQNQQQDNRSVSQNVVSQRVSDSTKSKKSDLLLSDESDSESISNKSEGNQEPDLQHQGSKAQIIKKKSSMKQNSLRLSRKFSDLQNGPCEKRITFQGDLGLVNEPNGQLDSSETTGNNGQNSLAKGEAQPQRRTLFQRAKDKESKVKFQSHISENQNENASSNHSDNQNAGQELKFSDQNISRPVTKTSAKQPSFTTSSEQKRLFESSSSTWKANQSKSSSQSSLRGQQLLNHPVGSFLNKIKNWESSRVLLSLNQKDFKESQKNPQKVPSLEHQQSSIVQHPLSFKQTPKRIDTEKGFNKLVHGIFNQDDTVTEFTFEDKRNRNEGDTSGRFEKNWTRTSDQVSVSPRFLSANQTSKNCGVSKQTKTSFKTSESLMSSDDSNLEVVPQIGITKTSFLRQNSEEVKTDRSDKKDVQRSTKIELCAAPYVII